MQLIHRLFGGKWLHKNNAADRPTGTDSQYRGVQVHAPIDSCCNAVREIRGKRFLSHEVPSLPLPECDAEICQCTFELFDDRRTDVRRISDVAFDIVGQYRENDQRVHKPTGRRSTD